MATIPLRGTKGNKSSELASTDTASVPNIKLTEQASSKKGVAVVDENGNVYKDASPFFDVSLVDLTSADNYYYYGGILFGAWHINRFDKTTLIKTQTNTGASDLATAWASRTTLTYI